MIHYSLRSNNGYKKNSFSYIVCIYRVQILHSYLSNNLQITKFKLTSCQQTDLVCSRVCRSKKEASRIIGILSYLRNTLKFFGRRLRRHTFNTLIMKQQGRKTHVSIHSLGFTIKIFLSAYYRTIANRLALSMDLLQLTAARFGSRRPPLSLDIAAAERC